MVPADEFVKLAYIQNSVSGSTRIY